MGSHQILVRSKSESTHFWTLPKFDDFPCPSHLDFKFLFLKRVWLLMKRGREELVAMKEELEKCLKVLSDEKDNITKELEKTSREIEIIEQKDFPIKSLSEAKSKEEALRLLKLYGRDKVKVDEETTVEDLISEKTEYII